MGKVAKSNDGYQRGAYGALRALMHFIAAVQFTYAIYYDFRYVHFPPEMRRAPGGDFGGKLKFLTVWDAVGGDSGGTMRKRFPGDGLSLIPIFFPFLLFPDTASGVLYDLPPERFHRYERGGP